MYIFDSYVGMNYFKIEIIIYLILMNLGSNVAVRSNT